VLRVCEFENTAADNVLFVCSFRVLAVAHLRPPHQPIRHTHGQYSSMCINEVIISGANNDIMPSANSDTHTKYPGEKLVVHYVFIFNLSSPAD
jgi:hypothetical protein